MLVMVCVALTSAILRGEGRRAGSREVLLFQRAVSGLGLGAVSSPAWTFHALDPRVDPTCEADSWPVPGGACYAPDHLGPVSRFPEPQPGQFVVTTPSRSSSDRP